MKRIHFKLLLTAIFWGGTFIAGRALSDHVAPFSAAFLRFFIAIASFFLFKEKLGPSKASLFINFVPISAIILAFLFLDEPITISLLAGAVMVSLGVYLTNKGSLFHRR